MHTEAIYANAFNLITELGPASLKKIHTHTTSYEYAWKTSAREFKNIGLDEHIISVLEKKRSVIDPLKEAEILKKNAIAVILPKDSVYPALLKTIPQPPQVLYVRGFLPKNDLPSVGVVGTRHPTTYGLEACHSITTQLTKAGVVIISGLARGIDTSTHKACLAGKGTTIAVLGCGIAEEVLYPANNKRLAQEIVNAGGAIISEFPYKMKAQTWTFPQRNRIIAGLANGILVVEAKKKSGARITANLAVEYGRDVYAIPGDIFSSNSWTPHMLIQNGALLVNSGEDILEALGMESTSEHAQNTFKNYSSEEQYVLNMLIEPKSAGELSCQMNTSVSIIHKNLTLLELKGMVKNIGGGIYRKV